MRTIIIGALALAGVALAAPANAQTVYFGVGTGPHYGSSHYYAPAHYYAPRPYRYYRAHRPRYVYSYAQDYRQCRIVKVWRGDHWRRIKRCW